MNVWSQWWGPRKVLSHVSILSPRAPWFLAVFMLLFHPASLFCCWWRDDLGVLFVLLKWFSFHPVLCPRQLFRRPNSKSLISNLQTTSNWSLHQIQHVSHNAISYCLLCLPLCFRFSHSTPVLTLRIQGLPMLQQNTRYFCLRQRRYSRSDRNFD